MKYINRFIKRQNNFIENRGVQMINFKQFIKFNKYLSLLCESEIALNKLSYYTLPITDELLTPEQINNVKRILSEYLTSFNLEVVNDPLLYDINDEYDESIYIDLKFGVVGRDKNVQLCTYDNGVIFTPRDLNNKVANVLLKNLNKINYLKGVIIPNEDNTNPKYSIAYETIFDVDGIGNQKRKLKIYLKFDFRKLEIHWDEKDFSHRSTVFDDITQKIIDLPFEESKLCLLSLHPE